MSTETARVGKAKSAVLSPCRPDQTKATQIGCDGTSGRPENRLYGMNMHCWKSKPQYPACCTHMHAACLGHIQTCWQTGDPRLFFAHKHCLWNSEIVNWGKVSFPMTKYFQHELPSGSAWTTSAHCCKNIAGIGLSGFCLAWSWALLTMACQCTDQGRSLVWQEATCYWITDKNMTHPPADPNMMKEQSTRSAVFPIFSSRKANTESVRANLVSFRLLSTGAIFMARDCMIDGNIL